MIRLNATNLPTTLDWHAAGDGWPPFKSNILFLFSDGSMEAKFIRSDDWHGQIPAKAIAWADLGLPTITTWAAEAHPDLEDTAL